MNPAPPHLTSHPQRPLMITAMTWEQICDDPHLRDLPFKIEQDRYGRILMSPPPIPDHGEYQTEIGYLLRTLLPEWVVITDCPTATPEGVRVPDLAAMTRSRRPRRGRVVNLPQAPEICVEILSASNSPEEMNEKRSLYAGQGCQEFWTCSQEGKMSFLDAASGRRLEASVICPKFPGSIRLG